MADALTAESSAALAFVYPSEAQAALGLVEPACAPASKDDLLCAFLWLASVTNSDKLKDGETASAAALALTAAMQDYPAFASLGAIRDWPKTPNGKWWPTENELRFEANTRATPHLRLRAHLRRSATSGSSPHEKRRLKPFGATEAFVADVSEKYGSAYVRSWLSGVTCQFEADTVWTYPGGLDRLHRDASGLAAKHRVELKTDKEAHAHFRKATEMYAGSFAMPKPKKKG